jgi:thiamine biosynthesis lipoprotein
MIPRHLLTHLLILTTTLFTSIAAADWHKAQRDIMGTRITVELWNDDAMLVQQCMDNVFAEMHRIDELMSPWKEDSELALLNREASSHPVKIGKELFRLIEQSQKISELSGGAFDITFASVGYLYDYREGVRPSDEEIADKIDAINYRHIRLDQKQNTVAFDKEGVRIDLGGIAKGYAVDNGIRLLKECGITNALVSAGGDTRLLGDRGGRPWMTGIQHPRKRPGVAVVLPLSDAAISTSGDYERFFIDNGERHHHIISPKTGKSVSETISATVIGPESIMTDALSTTLFILGAEKGMALIETLPDFDAIIIDSGGEMHYSKGLLPPTEQEVPN